jgi:hypothetical protein
VPFSIIGYFNLGKMIFFPPEATWEPKPTNEEHNDIAYDNDSWKQKRDEFAQAMWANRGQHTFDVSCCELM